MFGSRNVNFHLNYSGYPSILCKTAILSTGYNHGMGFVNGIRFFGSQAAEPCTSDGLTVERIVANGWPILDESESDWRSHASAIAQSIHLIKRRLKVIYML